MQLLIAHGDPASRLALRRVATEGNEGDLDVVESGDGSAAIEMLLDARSPALALIDWDLPGCDGPELCRLVRQYHEAGPPYIILLARGSHDVAEGLEAGADDCVRTPANAAELRARIHVGCRYAGLPWESVAASLAESHPAELEADEAPVLLDAVRVTEGDEPYDTAGTADAAPVTGREDEAPASLDAVRVPEGEEPHASASATAKFELKSVLVTP